MYEITFYSLLTPVFFWQIGPTDFDVRNHGKALKITGKISKNHGISLGALKMSLRIC